MDENLSEIERAEWLKGVIRDNWLYAVLGVAIAVGGIYGWRAWQAHEAGRSVAASQRYQQMLEAFGRNERELGFKLGGEIKDEYASTAFADQADLLLARVHVESGELDQAAAKLAAVMAATDDPELALVARLRLARVQIAQGNADQALKTLEGADVAAARARTEELRGDALFARGDRAGALKAYEAARAAATGSPEEGLVDVELLELKIDDLAGATTAASATAPAAAPVGGTAP